MLCEIPAKQTYCCFPIKSYDQKYVIEMLYICSHAQATVCLLKQQHHQTSAMTEMLESLITRMDQLEVSMTKLNKQSAYQPRTHAANALRTHSESTPRINRGPITCYSCGEVGHYARGCAPHCQSSQQGN